MAYDFLRPLPSFLWEYAHLFGMRCVLAVGTRIMQDNQVVGVDLPLRVIVWEDKLSRVRVGYPGFDTLVPDYGVTDRKIIDAMAGLVDKLVRASANVYAY